MFFHVLLTTECDLQCRYCYGKACDDIDSDFPLEVDYSLPKKVSYPVSQLAAFCAKDPECVLSFYGGEPMLRLAEIREIMDGVKAKHFLIQTNGLHLDKLEPEYVNRFHTILVSIDGHQRLTDYYRGRGVYQRVIDNLGTIKRNGFEGEIIARMTVMEKTDIAEEVMWLLHNSDFSFSSVHWQLDAGFWKNDFAKREFRQWAEESYNLGIRRLMRFWIDQMENRGKVLKLYPFLGVMHSLLHHEECLLRCGSGWINYSILTDGTVVPCPAMGGMKDFYLGHISNTHPKELKRILVSKPCIECEIINECGGRCLYANITKRWSDEAYALVCSTVKNLVSCLRQETSRVSRLITSGKIGLEDFCYLKYNGCEIIP
jgi:putative peptide-modifying radical SAM enzyme